MNVHQFLLILLARKKIILATLAATVLLTLGYSLIQSKTYKSTASVLLNYKGVDPLTGLTMPGQLLPGYMATQIDIISSKNVALRVVDQLKLASSPAVVAQFREASDGGRGTVRDWLADLLLKKLEIVPSRESSVVEISFKGADPQFVAAVANAFADEYQKISVQLKTEPMKKASVYFNDQTKLLRDNVEAAQARLSKYQQEKGIVSLDNNRVDIELSRLNDLSAQLVAAQSQTMEASSRQRMAMGSSASPDVANNAVVQNFKLALGAAESKLADLSQRLSRNHPLYQSAQAEVDQRRADLRAATASATSGVGSNAEVFRQREGELRSALAAQKIKVLELNRARDELSVLLKDVESAQRAFDATSQRFSQTRIEGQSEQSDISILNPATVPIDAAGPRVLLNTLVALMLGTILGVALAMLTEMLNRPIRSAGDLTDMLGIPVLGTVAWTRPRSRMPALKALLTPRRLRLN